jgi:hypothetical protein
MDRSFGLGILQGMFLLTKKTFDVKTGKQTRAVKQSLNAAIKQSNGKKMIIDENITGLDGGKV